EFQLLDHIRIDIEVGGGVVEPDERVFEHSEFSHEVSVGFRCRLAYAVCAGRYRRSKREPRRVRISYPIVPAAAAMSSTVCCGQISSTRSPSRGGFGASVVSMMIVSMDTRPTKG